MKTILLASLFLGVFNTAIAQPYSAEQQQQDSINNVQLNKDIRKKYAYTSMFNNGLAQVVDAKTCLWGAIDAKGNEVLFTKYQELELKGGGLIYAKKGGIAFYFLRKGEQLIPLQYGAVSWISDKHLLVNSGAMFGVIALDGLGILPMQYEKIISCNSTTYIVQQNNKKGVFATNGKNIIPVQFDDITPLGAAFLVKDGSNFQLLNHKAQAISKKTYTNANMVFVPNKTHIEVALNNKWGLLNEDGTETLTCENQALSYFGGHIVLIKNNDKTTIHCLSNTQPATNEAISHFYTIGNSSHPYLVFKKEQKYGAMPLHYKCGSDALKTYMEAAFDSIVSVDWNSFAVKQNQLWTLVESDHKHPKLLPNASGEQYKLLTTNLIAFKNQQKWTVWDIKTKKAWATTFEDIKILSNEFLAVKQNAKYTVWDTKGNKILTTPLEEVISYHQGIFKVKKGNEVLFMDKLGTIILGCK